MHVQHDMGALCYVVTILLCLIVQTLSFGLKPTGFCHYNQKQSFTFTSKIRKVHHLATQLQLSSNNEIDNTLLESLRSMRVKELKVELDTLSISTSDAFEKEELVQRLYNARIDGATSSVFANGMDNKKIRKKKKRRSHDDDDTSTDDTVNPITTSNNSNSNNNNANPMTTSNNNSNNSWTITTPLIYYELESSKSVKAQNANDIYIRPSPGKYASIKVQLHKQGIQTSPIEWMLLVDTACSGLVLSPNAVSKANSICPNIIQTIDNAATMTMAGSSQGSAVAKWDTYTKLTVGGVELDHTNVAACQDIGALPSQLDGIIGLSFLEKYACVDFDFVNDELRLDISDSSPIIPNVNDIVAKGPLSLTKLRIYTADVTLDGRGPVKLLVDTGAASSFLNWNGVSQMKLSSSSPQINPIQDSIGAMGADNMALQLTHRYKVKRRYNLVAENNAVPLPGIGLDEVCNVDIGDLPVLETLKSDDVGGILGADLLMMCDVVRFSGLNGGGSPTMILMKQLPSGDF